MTTLIKISAIGLIAAISCLYLKKFSPDVAILIAIAAGILIIASVTDYLFGVLQYLKDFFRFSGADSSVLKLVLKVIFVAYAVEFVASSIKDLGENSLSEKVVLAGKIIVLSLSLPVIKSVLETIVSLIKVNL